MEKFLLIFPKLLAASTTAVKADVPLGECRRSN
jgi:hypothetical protein